MNYLVSFAGCVALTVFSALGDSPHTKDLIMSDVNVAIWLWVAWVADKKHRGIDINLTIRRGE
ncbi:MAG: hypothetical protein ACOY3Z_06350 [Thermodesulfobacteriota bacterium]